MTGRTLAASLAATILLVSVSGCGWIEEARRTPNTAPHRVSATLSPLHLGFPIASVLIEQRVVDHVGVAEELGVGSYATAGIGQLGARVNVYPIERFNGLQLGAIVRSNMIVYPGRGAVTTEPSDAAAATGVVSNDVQLARANGRSSIFAGGILGLKGIISGLNYRTGQVEPTPLRGLTLEMGMLLGKLHMVGPAPYGAAPDAAILGDTFLALLELRLGWTL